MSFSQEWEQSYQDNTHMSVWPWSDLVSYVMRYAKPDSPKFRVLELGCGAGANIPFFQSLGVDYYAIEGSPTIVKNLKERYPNLKNNIVVGDFTTEYPIEFPDGFNLIIDRASLTCNTTQAIESALNIVNNKLVGEGKFIGIDWYSTQYSDYKKGIECEDQYTRTDFVDGSFAHTGQVHFSDKQHLIELFKDFEMQVMDHKVVKREIPDDGWNFASWNFVAQKK